VSLTPLAVVQPLVGAYKGSAGVVQKVERDEAGKEVSATVELDLDKKLVRFSPAELRVLRPHG
jgi:transcription elongation factor